MEDIERGSIQLELKYCERCGGLWLRLKGSDAIFCAGCAKSLAGLGPVRVARSAKPVQNRRGPEGRCLARNCGSPAGAHVEQVFWTEGGNA